MGKSFKYWIFIFAIAGFTFMAYSQTGQQGPPAPTEQGPSTGRGPCGEGTGGGNGPSIPPPVGLCLPINDYLFPLLISGVALGAFSLFRLQKKQEISSSAQ